MKAENSTTRALKAKGYALEFVKGTAEPVGTCLTVKVKGLAAVVNQITRTERVYVKLLKANSDTIEDATEEIAEILTELWYEQNKNKAGAVQIWTTKGGTRETVEELKAAGAVGWGWYTLGESDGVKYIRIEPEKVYGLNK